MPDTSKNKYSPKDIEEIIQQTKILAQRFQAITGKPLGITGEVGEFEAARILGLELMDARSPGYDAIRKVAVGEERIQIKSRRIIKNGPGQRIGSIRFNHEWDKVVLILLDEDFEPLVIYEAERDAVEKATNQPGSRSRNERGALSVNKFKSISKLIWERAKVINNLHGQREQAIKTASDLLAAGESAICVFTYGDYFDIEQGTTGYWSIDPNELVDIDRVIVYFRDGQINGIYTGKYLNITPAPPDWPNRYIIHAQEFVEVGTTESNWHEFGDGGRNPAQIIRN